MKTQLVILGTVLLILGSILIMPTRQSPPLHSYATANVHLSSHQLRVRIPLTTAASEQGLDGVTRLSDQEGMLWRFTDPQRPTFWMKGMKIPLDLIWIRDGRVMQITPNAPTPTANDLPLYQPKELVTNVLEVRAGFAADYHIVPGTEFSFELIEP